MIKIFDKVYIASKLPRRTLLQRADMNLYKFNSIKNFREHIIIAITRHRK